MTTLKTDLINVLSPIFGQQIEKTLTEHYDNSRPEELLELAYHMLIGYMGEKNARRLLHTILKDYPKLRLGVC